MERQYDYQPLPDPSTYVRILSLRPGAYNDPLHGSLQHSQLSASLQYNALSYCWGLKSDGLSNLYLHTDSGITVVKIYLNLARALRRLRSTSETLRLWTDAVCINQDPDAPEKPVQIGMMSGIYQNAVKVIVYLGELDELSPAVFPLLRRIGEAYAQTSASDQRSPQQWCAAHGIPPIHDAQSWKPLQDFLRRAWFRRAWIIQECVFGQDLEVRCGGWTADWRELMDVLRALYKYGNLGLLWTCYGGIDEVQQSLSQLNYLRNLKDAWAQQARFTFMNVAYKMQCANATDTRDNIFALLNLACDVTIDTPKPRYDTGNAVLGNCVRYAYHFLDAKDNLEVLYWAGQHGQKLKAPSWVCIS